MWYKALVRPVSLRLLVMITVALVLLNAALLFPGRRGPAAAEAGSSGAPGSGAGRALRVGLVFDVGGRGDKSFNDAAYRGVERATHELHIAPEFVEPGDGADRESGLRLLAARGFDLVLGVGFVFSDDMIQVARDYPGSKFACIDYAKFDANGFVMPPPNMVALKFREEEGSFLAGAVAALLSPGHTIGFVGGMDIPLIHKFEAGYRQGALAVCASCRVLVGYAGTSPEAFKNPAKGKELALAQYAAGAAVIFHAAGSTGLGVFEAASTAINGTRPPGTW
jgi:basic membrane protein A